MNARGEVLFDGGKTWTTEPPTEPGWYWVHTTPEDDPINPVTEVVELEGPGAAFTLKEHGLSLNTRTHWLGPLPEPEPPKP